MNISTIIAICGLGIGVIGLSVACYTLIQIRSLNAMRKSFFAGSKGADLEETIRIISSKFENLKSEHEILEHAHKSLLDNFQGAVQKVGVVRFNPFDDAGGNFSFTTALLNAKNSGIVITSIHGRQQNRIYAKQITQGQSETPLTDEEAQAIATADSKYHEEMQKP